MQNGYPSNARHKMFDLTRKAIIFNLALRPAQIVSCKKYQFGNYSFAEPWCPVKAAAAAAGQGSDLQEDHCLPAEQQLNASQSRRLQKSQSAHIKSHGFSLLLSFFSIIQRSVEG